MKLLTDENIPLETVELLEESGFNVLSILRNYSGIADREIIDLANKEDRLIITFDKDFGFLVFAKWLLPKKGIIFLRNAGLVPEKTAQLLIKLLQSDYSFDGQMTVVTDHFIRQRKFQT
jgi:predicted nuclease of predicted toxin-antitoxin system